MKIKQEHRGEEDKKIVKWNIGEKSNWELFKIKLKEACEEWNGLYGLYGRDQLGNQNNI